MFFLTWIPFLSTTLSHGVFYYGRAFEPTVFVCAVMDAYHKSSLTYWKNAQDDAVSSPAHGTAAAAVGPSVGAPTTPTAQPPPMTHYATSPPPQGPAQPQPPPSTAVASAQGNLHWCEANSVSGDNKDPGYYNRGWNDPLAVMQSGYTATAAQRKAPSRRRYNYALASVTTGVGATGIAPQQVGGQYQPPVAQYGQQPAPVTMPPPVVPSSANMAPPPSQPFVGMDASHPHVPPSTGGPPVFTTAAAPTMAASFMPPLPVVPATNSVSATMVPPQHPAGTAPAQTSTTPIASADTTTVPATQTDADTPDGADAGMMGGFKMVEMAPVLTVAPDTAKQPTPLNAHGTAAVASSSSSTAGSGRHDPPVAYTSSFEPPSFASAAASKDLCDMLRAFVAEKVDRSRMNRRAADDMDSRLRVLCDALTTNRLVGPAREQVADMIGALADERYDSVRQNLAVLVERFPMDAEGWIVGMKRILHEVDASTVVQAPHPHQQPEPQTPPQPFMMPQQPQQNLDMQPPALMPSTVPVGTMPPASYQVSGSPQHQPQQYNQQNFGGLSQPQQPSGAYDAGGGAPLVQSYDMGAAAGYSYPAMPTHQEQQQHAHETGVGGTLDRLHSWVRMRTECNVLLELSRPPSVGCF